jgi:quinol monooxygenase YgiN
MIQAYFRVVAPEGKRGEILEVLLSLKGPTEVSHGCRACRILLDAEDENALTYLEQWKTREDLEEHLRSERFRRLLPVIDMSAECPDIQFSAVGDIQGLEYLTERDTGKERMNRGQRTVLRQCTTAFETQYRFTRRDHWGSRRRPAGCRHLRVVPMAGRSTGAFDARHSR